MWKKVQSKLQSFAGAMMVPIILMVLVGFFVSVGSAFTNYICSEGTFWYNFFDLLTRLGFMFMNNLSVWYAIAISFTLAKKERGWAAFTGFILYMCINVLIEEYAGLKGWTRENTAIAALIEKGYSEQEALTFNALWTTSLGMFTYDMGIFSGIIIGLLAAWIHNKFVDTELPQMFGFFAGPKMVIIISALASIPISVIIYYLWPYVARGISSLTHFISASGLFGTFAFGTIDKLLLPFGLHHLIAFPIEYSAVGGTMEIDGELYYGVHNIMAAQSASPTAVGYITHNFSTGRILFQLAGIPGAALAIYKEADKDNQKKVSSLLIPAVFTLAMVGISEPFEYTFLFAAPQLYFLIYAPLCGLCYVLAEITHVQLLNNALMFMIPNLFQPHKVHAMSLIWLLPLTFAAYYFIFRFFIRKWNLSTPGRKSAEAKLISKKEYQERREAENSSSNSNIETGDDADLINNIINALGGADNIEGLMSCATRLRVVVKDSSLVAEDNIWKEKLKAIGVVRLDNTVQIIYGVQVQNIATKIKDRLDVD